MDGSNIDVFALAERRMAWLDERQRVLAQNIANVDTPGFQPSDLSPFEARLAASGMTPTRTDARHLAGPNAGRFRADHARVAERAPDGNAISVEHEMTKIADSETTHALVTDLYKKYMSMFLTVIGKS